MHTVNIKTPFAYWDRLFTEKELKEIDEFIVANYIPEKGTVGDNQLNEEVRTSTVYWINYGTGLDWVFDRINVAGNKLNASFFGFDIEHVDVLQYTIYPENSGHYSYHVDMFIAPDLTSLYAPKQRKLSLVLQCQNVENGGDLELVLSDNPIVVKKEVGTVVVFPSYTLHRVTQSTSGIRKSLVAWFTGPDWK